MHILTVAAVAVFAALSGLTVITLIHPTILALARSPILSSAVATASLLVASGAMYVAVTEFLLYGILSSLCLGTAFLVLAGGVVSLHLVPLLMGSATTAPVTRLSLSEDTIIAGALFVAAVLTMHWTVSVSHRIRVTVLSLVGGGLFSLLLGVVSAGGDLQSLAHTAGPLPSLVSAVLLFSASVLFGNLSRRTYRAWFLWLAASLGFAGFASLQYAIREYPVTVVQPGDVLLLVAFTAILFALASEWSHSYLGLHWEARELGVMHALTSSAGSESVTGILKQIERIAGETLDARAQVWLAPNRSEGDDDSEEVDLGGGGVLALERVMRDLDTAFGPVALGVPLLASGRLLGVLLATRDTRDDFRRHDVSMMRAFAAQASILLERSALSEELEAGAIRQERLRLAREIHDGLAQHLAFLKMKVALLQRGPMAVSNAQLRDIEGMLETALIEARHAIFTLRSELEGTSVSEAIAQYTEEFGQVSGLEVDVQYDHELPVIGPKSRVELLRIVQESLNNVRKYAGASAVNVSLQSKDEKLAVCIEDNGTGFDVTESAQGHFGLEIMRERAESVGGTLTITSTPNQGTTIWVSIPVLAP